MVCTVCAVVGMRSLEEQEKWPLFGWAWVYAGRWENAAQQVPQGKSPEVRDRSAWVQIVGCMRRPSSQTRWLLEPHRDRQRSHRLLRSRDLRLVDVGIVARSALCC